MTDVLVVCASNRSHHGDLMQQYFQKRHDIFVDERGWRNLERSDGFEIDQYDTDNTAYLVAVDGSKVVGGSRFNPTLRPHMISELFMHLVERELPRGLSILEWSRYFITRERRVGRTECRLLAAVQRYCLEEGITSLTGLQDMWWVPRWLQLGFDVRPLGLPQLVNGEPTAAVEIKISEKSLASVTRLAGLKTTRLARTGLRDPLFELDAA